MKTNIYLTYLRYRERVIVYLLICLFLFAFIFLLRGIEIITDLYPYRCLAVIGIALISFGAINYLNNKL